MDIFEDYAHYMQENNDILETILKEEAILSTVIIDVIAVTDKIYTAHLEGEKVESDIYRVFETGFKYVANLVELINSYFQDVFNYNKILLKYYAPLLFFLIITDDMARFLETNNKSNKDSLEQITLIQQKIYDIFRISGPINDKITKEIEEQIQSVPMGKDYMPIYLMYSYMYDEMEF